SKFCHSADTWLTVILNGFTLARILAISLPNPLPGLKSTTSTGVSSIICSMWGALSNWTKRTFFPVSIYDYIAFIVIALAEKPVEDSALIAGIANAAFRRSPAQGRNVVL